MCCHCCVGSKQHRAQVLWWHYRVRIHTYLAGICCCCVTVPPTACSLKALHAPPQTNSTECSLLCALHAAQAQHTHTPPLPACRHTRSHVANSPIAVNACGSSGASVGTCCASTRRRSAQGCAARRPGACLQDTPHHTAATGTKGGQESHRSHCTFGQPAAPQGCPHDAALPCLLGEASPCVLTLSQGLRQGCQQQLCWDAPQASLGCAAAQTPHPPPRAPSPAYDSRCSAGRMPPVSLMMLRTSSTRILGLTCRQDV